MNTGTEKHSSRLSTQEPQSAVRARRAVVGLHPLAPLRPPYVDEARLMTPEGPRTCLITLRPPPATVREAGADPNHALGAHAAGELPMQWGQLGLLAEAMGYRCFATGSTIYIDTEGAVTLDPQSIVHRSAIAAERWRLSSRCVWGTAYDRTADGRRRSTTTGSPSRCRR